MCSLKKMLLLIICCFSIAGIAQNAIVNGNFQTGDLSGWDGFKNQVFEDNTIKSYVGRIENGQGSFLQVFDVVPGETYNVIFDYKWVSGAGTYNMTAMVREGVTESTILGSVTLNTTPDLWEKGTSFSFTAPAGVTIVRLVFYKTNGNRPLNLDNVLVINNNYNTNNFVDANTLLNTQPVGVSGEWTLDFSDEFNDGTLNIEKWQKIVSTRSRSRRPELGISDWWWVEDNAFLNDIGQLVLRGTKVDHNTMYCGSVYSRGLYEVKFGYLEARIKVAETAKGNHTAFWLQGENQSNVDNSAADGAEIDIFESAWTNDTTKAVVHYDGYSEAHRKNHTIPFNVPNIHTGYHTFGLLWTSSTMDIYYDGKKVVSTLVSKPFPFSINPTNGHDLVPKVPEWLWLSVGASFGDGDFISQPVGHLSDALVDYVRVFKPAGETLSSKNKVVKRFKVYPNPVKDFIYINGIEGDYSVSLLDMNGRKVLQKIMSGLKAKIDISNYQKGIYLIRIESDDNKSELFKVVF